MHSYWGNKKSEICITGLIMITMNTRESMGYLILS